jgi:hypothetical protein
MKLNIILLALVLLGLLGHYRAQGWMLHDTYYGIER